MDMLPISKRLLVIALPVGILLAAGLALVARGPGFGHWDSGNTPAINDVSRLSTYRIPDSLNFCDERMPLEIPDVRERMEQAFYIELSDAQIILDLKRSTKYFPYIEEKLREMDLPEDLKYLPVAESALRNLVSSRGAAGLWQFTVGTARHYGLRVNYYVDERYNFRKATVAALNHLNALHSEFGSWTLAAAAYNMGKNGIERTVNYQMTKNYYSLQLNDETSRFVFRIVALKQIMSHYKRYGFDLTKNDFYQAPEVRSLQVKQINDLPIWARNQGTSYREVKYLNPWLKESALPSGSWTVDLPQFSQPVMFSSATPAAGDSASSSQPNLTYVVRRGDSLTRIADIYGVSVKDLRTWNDLRQNGYLKAGQTLTIYANARNFER
jgi:peptidoglycan lytic transglycosylase D